ncbi:hypothetical protein [Streptomyces chrestomyceticus]|uniref:hypothetical protein n=1 Tax=Streptomyces chrestomyceticus TaxID=68185 RepID=UPI0035A967AA
MTPRSRAVRRLATTGVAPAALVTTQVGTDAGPSAEHGPVRTHRTAPFRRPYS